mgnify:CR=1 FL=1
MFLPLIANELVVDLPRVIPLPSARLNVPVPLLVKIPWSPVRSLTVKCPDAVSYTHLTLPTKA